VAEPGSPGLPLAPRGARVLAFLLDGLILIVAIITLGAMSLSLGMDLRGFVPIPVFVLALYHIGFLTAAGATPGKAALGLSVVTKAGAAVPPDTAILRFLVYFVCGALFPLGTLLNLALFLGDGRRRTLPDRVAGTVVVRGGVAREEGWRP
jgi:uncharacterized RDD family membrane protein YckC